ncbi:hypothetical protein Gotri_007742 [Gossypium trilobum]|uniref:DUF7745 domain-containing protein n=1 Tax=Gossypium trilobum TaxID=34281 RepID=A0A7J9EH30_9ROSI|nr:hypothetical protein [Gossypium trilobum]
MQYWNLAYSWFTFGKVDLVPTVEEYTTLLCCPRIQANKAYSRAANILTFLKRLISITGMSEQWVVTRIKQKGDSKCIPWKSLRDLILAHPYTRKKVDIFTLSIYGLVIFPKVLRHIDDAVSDLFDRLDKKVMPVPAGLVETLISLSACRRAGELRFIESRQFIPATQGLAQCEFAYKGKRVNDNVHSSSQENTRSIEEHLQVVLSELGIVKQDFEKKNSELGKRIEKLEEEKI